MSSLHPCQGRPLWLTRAMPRTPRVHDTTTLRPHASARHRLPPSRSPRRINTGAVRCGPWYSAPDQNQITGLSISKLEPSACAPHFAGEICRGRGHSHCLLRQLPHRRGCSSGRLGEQQPWLEGAREGGLGIWEETVRHTQYSTRALRTCSNVRSKYVLS
jgi:hypothetical protein